MAKHMDRATIAAAAFLAAFVAKADFSIDIDLDGSPISPLAGLSSAMRAVT